MYLFSSLKLTLAGQMVEHVNYPGQATPLLGLATYSPDYSKGCGLIQGWTPGINANAAAANTGIAVRQCFLVQCSDPKGSFQCAIPMRHIFGFTYDYTKVTYGMRDTLQLIRKDDNDCCCRGLRTYRHRTFRHRIFRHNHFVTQTYRHRTKRHTDISSPDKKSHGHIVTGHFVTKTFRHTDILSQVFWLCFIPTA